MAVIKYLGLAVVWALTLLTTVKGQCCDFSSTSCSWTLNGWKNSDSSAPSLSNYPNFDSTKPSADYIYLQDKSDSTISTTKFSIPEVGTVISFDYFFDSPNENLNSFFYVYFNNDDGSHYIAIANVKTQNSNWQHYSLVCDSSNAYCCGSADSVPCQGTLEITVKLDSSSTTGLTAIDNIGTCGDVAPTDTTPTTTTTPGTGTTAAPPATGCCDFESNNCGYTLLYEWYWSVQQSPAGQIPSFDGQFMWTDFYNAELLSDEQSNVDSTTSFAISYYINSSSAHIDVFFQQSTGFRYQLTTLSNSGSWQTVKIQNATYCGTPDSTCDGQLVFISGGTGGAFIAAIDDIERDGACDSSGYPCCDFDNGDMCGFTSDTVLGYFWKSYPESSPTNTPPNPGSNYVFFETVNYSGTSTLTVTLYSQEVTINSNDVFQGRIYATPGSSAENALEVNFRNLATGVTTELDYASDTSGAWSTPTYSCTSPHGNCCQGASSCTGYIGLTAHVDPNGGSVIYGVDEFDVTGDCAPL